MMNNLCLSQQGFADMLGSAPTTSLILDKCLCDELKHYSSEERQARLAIYKNNVYHSLTVALKDLYPSVLKVLGEEFFGAMTKLFIQDNLPKEPQLSRFGEHFPSFLQEFEHTKAFLYLPDLARLEFYLHQAYYAQDQDVISANDAAKLDIDALCESSVEFVSSSKIIFSEYSVFSLWQQLERDGLSEEDSFDIEQKENILIYRDSEEKSFEVHSTNLEDSLAYFLGLLCDGQTIGFALEQALETYSNFDASAAIAFIFSNALVHRLLKADGAHNA